MDRFVNGVTSDLDAVTGAHERCGAGRDTGLSLPLSSGPVEGNVNRITMLQRQMNSRAGFVLLRKRVLPAP
ncbi:hypothetical protein Aab01nite_32300 [Paractinoplanes abujensis]|uniref:Transposase n=1 Tax=Paractinoplanes abujensis TaxID=882441 RepID=A0A7W7D050_9ACTN|nr:transposase [Actinoplanes abujensis]MBB4697877.1 transposase [Actinoplanes abujensis]GID19640.1 hypothetical protein Aab01nite_32300 [Actinoplanes abujensis]